MKIITTDRPISFTLDPDGARVEPITLEWLKAWLRFPTTAEDAILTTAITMARMHFEEQANRQCIDAVWEYALEGAPDGPVLEIPRPPLQRIVSVSYDDEDGLPQAIDPAQYVVHPSFVQPEASGSPTDPVALDPYCIPGTITLIGGDPWPSSLRVRRVCGYGATPDVMPGAIQMVLGMITQYYHQRQSGALGEGVQHQINAFKWTALTTRPPISETVGS